MELTAYSVQMDNRMNPELCLACFVDEFDPTI